VKKALPVTVAVASVMARSRISARRCAGSWPGVLRVLPELIDEIGDAPGGHDDADGDHAESDAVLGEILTGLVTSQMLEQIDHRGILRHRL
jgi:hypothetical protein